MASPASFQRLAKKLINDTFGEFRKPITLQQVEFDNLTETNSTIASDTTTGIRLSTEKTKFEGQNIQIGDYVIILEKQVLNVDVRSDNTAMTFDGRAVEIIMVLDDAADAAINLMVRDK